MHIISKKGKKTDVQMKSLQTWHCKDNQVQSILRDLPEIKEIENLLNKRFLIVFQFKNTKPIELKYK